jgi:predicted amidohydrolase YtcJ
MLQTVRIPLLHDRHSHASFYASLIGCPSLSTMTQKEALKTIRELPEDRLSVVFGWHSARMPLAAEELAKMPPAIIVNVSMHGFVLSEQAVGKLEGVQPEVTTHRGDPEWIERNLPMLLELFSRTAGLTPEKLDTFMGRMEALGLGVVDDMLLPGDDALEVIQGSRWSHHIHCWATPRTYRALNMSSKQALRGLKFFTDGALGVRTAALRGTFLDGSEGLLLYTDEELAKDLGEAAGFGKPIAIHAIGDRAIEQVLTTLERLDRTGIRFPLVRLEHVQFIDEIQARRAKALGLVLSMQPNFNSDSQDYSDRLAAHWLEINNPFRMLIDRVGFIPGKDLILGSDGMPHGIEYALQWSLFPLYDGQRLSLEELVAGYGQYEGVKGESVLEIDRDQRRVTMMKPTH